MNRFWAVLSFLHTSAGPITMLLYPLYASVMAIESTSKLDDEQWLAYWICWMIQFLATLGLEKSNSVMFEAVGSVLFKEGSVFFWILYSFLTLMEMVLLPVLQWVPMWYDIKLALVAWLVLPQFRGASFIYEKFVREKIIKRYNIGERHGRKHPDPATFGKEKDDKENKKDDKENKFVNSVTPVEGVHEAY